MREENESVWLTSPSLDLYGHVCVFYRSADEEYRLLDPFISEGFKRGDKAFHIIDRRKSQDHRRRLLENGIDVPAAERTGQLEIRGWENAHLLPGWFDQHAMLALAEEVLDGARRQGFPFTRWVANMGWALEDTDGVSDLVEYCARLNYVVPKFPTTIVCTYDLAAFSATAVMDVLRTHPAAVVGGVVRENPYHVSPDQLIEEMRQHDQQSATGGSR